MTDNLPASVREWQQWKESEVEEYPGDQAIRGLIAEVERLNRLLNAATETLEMLTDPCDDEPPYSYEQEAER